MKAWNLAVTKKTNSLPNIKTLMISSCWPMNEWQMQAHSPTFWNWQGLITTSSCWSSSKYQGNIPGCSRQARAKSFRDQIGRLSGLEGGHRKGGGEGRDPQQMDWIRTERWCAVYQQNNRTSILTKPVLNGYIYPKQTMKLTFAKITREPKV